MTYRSPLRYPGGKTRAITVLQQQFEKWDISGTNGTLISPFFGGGSFEFSSGAQHILANDLFEPLYNFWSQTRDNRSAVVDEVTSIKASGFKKEDFVAARGICCNISGELPPERRAGYYFAINRSSFNGSTFCGGFSSESESKRFTESSIRRLTEINLEHVEFSNEDFEPFIMRVCPQNAHNINAAMYLDPPYDLQLKRSYLYGRDGDMHQSFDHTRLRDLLARISVGALCDDDCATSSAQVVPQTATPFRRWILSYNDCPHIRELYSDNNLFEIKTAHWSYGMNRSKKSSEILICHNEDHIKK